MQDQVSKLRTITGDQHVACFLGSAQTDRTMDSQVLNGDYKIVYISPEKFDSFLGSMLSSPKMNIGLFAIDEAHCISEYGVQFRPSFRKLSCIRECNQQIPIMALTASATPRVGKDVISCLRMRNPFVSQSTFDRTNIAISCKVKVSLEADFKDMIQDAKANKSSSIVYVATIAGVEEIASYLQARLGGTGVVVEKYHSKLSQDHRKNVHEDFLVGKVHVVVATIAFGMGIDKPDIRYVLHYGPPKTMEEYVQQIGRAGRDGLTSKAQLVYAATDFDKYYQDFYMRGHSAESGRLMNMSTDLLKSYATRWKCRRVAIMKGFKEEPPFESCGTCDVCVQNDALASAASNCPINAEHVEFLAAVTKLICSAINRYDGSPKNQNHRKHELGASILQQAPQGKFIFKDKSICSKPPPRPCSTWISVDLFKVSKD